MAYGSIDIQLSKDRTIKRIVSVAFPNYRKRTAWLSTFSERGQQINSYWDGGTRDEYAIVRLDDMTRAPMPSVGHPYFEVRGAGIPSGEDQYVSIDRVGNVTLKALPPGFVLVCAGTFCGKPATAKIYVNPADMPRMLPAPAPKHTCHMPSSDFELAKRNCPACNEARR